MLPRVHHENRSEPADVSYFVKGDPMIGQRSAIRILIANGPADTPHFSDTYKVGFPEIKAAKRLLGRGGEGLVGSPRAAAFHVSKVVFMQHHAVIFKAESARQL